MTSSGQSLFDSSRSRRANDSNLIDLCLTIQTSSKGVRQSLKVLQHFLFSSQAVDLL